MPQSTTNIRRVFAQLRGTAAADVPVDYELTCDCGAQLSGVRGTSSKQHVCPDCFTKYFVLPVNVYPRTPSVPSEVIAGSFVQRLTSVVGDRLPALRSKKQPSPQRANGAPIVAATDTTDESVSRALPRVRLPKIDVAAFLRRTFRPFRLLMLGMALVVAGTSWYIWQQNNIESARLTWRESLDQIPALLAEDDFDQLAGTLDTAVAAGRTLGRDGAEWREVLNLQSETEVLSKLSYATLPALLLEACDRSGQLQNSRLDSLREALDGVYFVMDGFVDPSGDGTGSYIIDIPVISGSRRVRVRLDLPELDALLDRTETGQIIFAFRCLGVTTDGDSESSPVFVDVDPSSFVLFTQEAHCLRLGLSVDEDPGLGERLATQLAFIRESESWSNRIASLADQPVEGDSP